MCIWSKKHCIALGFFLHKSINKMFDTVINISISNMKCSLCEGEPLERHLTSLNILPEALSSSCSCQDALWAVKMAWWEGHSWLSIPMTQAPTAGWYTLRLLPAARRQWYLQCHCSLFSSQSNVRRLSPISRFLGQVFLSCHPVRSKQGMASVNIQQTLAMNKLTIGSIYNLTNAVRSGKYNPNNKCLMLFTVSLAPKRVLGRILIEKFGWTKQNNRSIHAFNLVRSCILSGRLQTSGRLDTNLKIHKMKLKCI